MATLDLYKSSKLTMGQFEKDSLDLDHFTVFNIHTVVILVHSSLSEDAGGGSFIPLSSEVILRFLLDKDFFFEALVIVASGMVTSPRSSNKLSTDPPRFLKHQTTLVSVDFSKNVKNMIKLKSSFYSYILTSLTYRICTFL